MDFDNSLLRKYRDDRRRLTEFLFSSGLTEVKTAASPTTSYSTIDFHSISTDYVLDCIRSGDVLDVSQATDRYFNEACRPIMAGDTFYLQTLTESAGSPPHRVPPSLPLENGKSVESFNIEKKYYEATGRLPVCSAKEGANSQGTTKVPVLDSVNHKSVPTLGLPSLKTGLLDDDLRESAYEVFLSCMLFSRPEIQATESRNMEKRSKLFSILKSRREKNCAESEYVENPWNILHAIRTQMQISESVDSFIRRRLVILLSDKSLEQIDIPRISLALLTGVTRSIFTAEKHFVHWRNRQANVLEEILCSDNHKIEKKALRAALEKIRNLQEWEFKMSTSEKDDVLLSADHLAASISSVPGRFGVDGETRYWTSCYHMNCRLYEKLLFGLFDILEDCTLIEEAGEILKLLKLTWPILGITERLHHALFSWVLFQQFHATEEQKLLEYAVREVGRTFDIDSCSPKEIAYLRSLVCFRVAGNETRLNVIQSIFSSISSWCDSKLQDYHLYFDQNASFFGTVVEMALRTGTCVFVSPVDIQFSNLCLPNEIASEKIRTYVDSSMDAAWKRVVGHLTNGRVRHYVRHLADLANNLKQIAEKELYVFSPVLRCWYPECAMFAAKILHQCFGERLIPFLKDPSCLTEDITEVLTAAYSLECCLIGLYSSSSSQEKCHFVEHFNFYPIAEVSKPIILDWIVGQHGRVMEWTCRTFDIEDWEPLSVQQKIAASAVEVFRIIEETVDQFFAWSLPMDATHLQALLSVVFHALDNYLTRVDDQLVEKQSLYPSTPPLTRYKEASFLAVNKILAKNLIVDDAVYKKLEELTISKLCIRLNTYQYIKKQIDVLEDNIQKSWQSVISKRKLRYSMEKPSENSDSTDLNVESVSELFVATLDCVKNSAADAVQRTSEFLGTKIVFWDMRDSFLLKLYHVSVEGNRIESFLPQIDSVLNVVCGFVDNAIRDLVVMNIWKETKEGFMWVLLDGGPTRSFSDSDIPLIEEDFNMLMDLFVADGQGIPRCVVEEDAKLYREILLLFSLQTESLIQTLIDSSHHISVNAGRTKHAMHYFVDSHTLLRILCHKKDKRASKFLKTRYNLPPSSEYSEITWENSNFSSPVVADMIRSASLRWSEKGQSSIRSLKKKLQETTWK